MLLFHSGGWCAAVEGLREEDSGDEVRKAATEGGERSCRALHPTARTLAVKVMWRHIEGYHDLMSILIQVISGVPS